MKQIDSLVIDALKEVSNIAAGHLSEVVSQLTGKEMSISVPDSNILNVKDAADTVGGNGATIIVGYMNVFGDVNGSMVFLIPKKDAVKLTTLTLEAKVSPLLFPSALERDALRELVTIMGGAFISAITQFLGVYFVPTSPIISSFSAFNLLNYLKTREGSIENYESRDIVLVSIKYFVEKTETSGEIIMLVGPKILDYLSKKLTDKE